MGMTQLVRVLCLVSAADASTVFMNTALRHALGPELANHVSNLYWDEFDRNEFGPLIHYDREMLENGRVVRIDRKISVHLYSSIFQLTNGQIIKYQVNCENMKDPLDIHPLVRDFIFLKAVEDLKVSPQAHFLSLGIKFENVDSPKVNFSMDPQERDICAKDARSILRFMVMEKALISFDTLLKGSETRSEKISLASVVSLIAGAVSALSELHIKKNIIHGDVHYGNLVLLNAERKVGLIDFGSASYLSELQLTQDMSREPFSYNHCYLSHWNLEGYRFSFRDDIYKAIFAGAMMLNGSPFVRFCRTTDIHTLYEFKANGFFFNLPNHPDMISQVPNIRPEQVGEIRAHLNQVLLQIRSVNTLDAMPPYREILAQLDAVLAILTIP